MKIDLTKRSAYVQTVEALTLLNANGVMGGFMGVTYITKEGKERRMTIKRHAKVGLAKGGVSEHDKNKYGVWASKQGVPILTVYAVNEGKRNGFRRLHVANIRAIRAKGNEYLFSEINNQVVDPVYPDTGKATSKGKGNGKGKATVSVTVKKRRKYTIGE